MADTPGQLMYAAINAGDGDAVRRILQQNPDQLTEYPGVASSWLHYAARKGKPAVIGVFLAAGLDVNWGRREPGDTPLDDAVSKGELGTAEYLLSIGANPNLGRELIAAMNAKHNQFELVKLLVEHGADVNRCWRFGDEQHGPLFNALSWAINKHRDEIADYLRAHGAVMPTVEAPTVPKNEAQEIIAYFERRFGKADAEALRGIVPSSDTPVAICRIGPTAERTSQILFTIGMSDNAMIVPDAAEKYRFAELVLELPADWPLDVQSLADANRRWPIDWLRKIAAYPEAEKTWLGGPFVIMSNGEPPLPFSPNCRFAAMLIVTGYDNLGTVHLESGKLLQLYTLIPLYPEEKELEQRHNLPELFRRLDQFSVGRMIDVNRPNVAAAR